MANIGDKYIIEIAEAVEKRDGTLYRIKGFNSLVFDEAGLKKIEKVNEYVEPPEVISGFAELARMIAAGVGIKAGQKVNCQMKNGEETEWVVVETRPEIAGDGCVILSQRTVNHYSAFSEVSKEYPYGSNDYMISMARKYLTGEFADNFADDDLSVIVKRRLPQIGENADKFWLLDKDEVSGETPFEWYQDSKHRKMQDTDGDDCYWFLRGAHPSYAYYVRVVYRSGALSGISAYYASGLVAACIIKKSNHPSA